MLTKIESIFFELTGEGKWGCYMLASLSIE